MPLIDKIKSIKQPNKPNGPVWAGPESDKPNGGVTYSLLSRYLGCKERFRIHTIEGLRPREGFNPKIEFGSMWHVCEESNGCTECTVCNGSSMPNGVSAYKCPGCNWDESLKLYCVSLCNKYRTDQAQIDHWYNICKSLFPVYLEHWSKHPESKTRTPLLRETVFHVPYKLPSGRTVYLRGKWDGVDLQGKGVWLNENKTKSSIDTDKINRQLRFDLQTMMYLVSFDIRQKNLGIKDSRGFPVGSIMKGIRYNVVRRSAHKSIESMLKKVEDDTKAGRINEWFARWDVEVVEQDYMEFKFQCLDPILENLCDDYEWWAWCHTGKKGDPVTHYRDWVREEQFPKHCPRHFRLPFGIWNVVAEGGISEYDTYLESGSTVGLVYSDNLFPELSNE